MTLTATTPDAQLLAAWRRLRDDHAFGELCQRHAAMVHAACRRLGSPEADEAAQAVFVVLAQRPTAVRDGRRLAGWLIGTARRVVAHQRRALARRRRHEAEAAMQRERQALIADEPSSMQALPLLDEALAALSPGRREALIRFYLEGRSQADIAAELGCSTDAVKVRVHEGLTLLRRWFARRGHVLAPSVLAAALMHEAQGATPATVATCAAAATSGATGASVALATTVGPAMAVSTTLVSSAAVVAIACISAIGLAVLNAETARSPAATVAATASSGPVASAPADPPPSLAAGDPLDPRANAALAWFRAADAMPSHDADLVVLHQAKSEESAEAWASASRLFARPQPALDLFVRGSRASYCDWGQRRDDGSGLWLMTLAPQISVVRKLESPLRFRARWRAVRGDTAGAVDDACAVLRAAHLFAGGSDCVVEWTVAQSLVRSAFATAAAILPHLDADQRALVTAELRNLPPFPAAADAFAVEIAHLRDDTAVLRSLSADERMALLSQIGQRFGVPMADASLLRTMIGDMPLRETAERLEREAPAIVAELRKPSGERHLEHCALTIGWLDATMDTLFLAPSLQPAALSKAEITQQTERAQLEAALAWYDDGDAGLATHPDPLTGEAFAREATADGFSLTATGPRDKPLVLTVGFPELQPPAGP